MTQRLAGKTCLLMGGGTSFPEGGLSNGQAVALTFAREGARIAVADLRLDAAQDTVKQILAVGGEAFALRADVSRHVDVRDAVQATLDRWSRIDILHNNVGIEARGGILDTTEEAWDRVHDINLKGAFLACKEVIPAMQSQGGGSIINVSSTASLKWGPAEFISYNSSKAALNHLTRVLARQFAPMNIRCNAVLPGMIDTPHIRTLYKDKTPEELAEIMVGRNARCPMGRQGTSQEVANAALFLASDEASYVSGVLLTVDGASSV
ncbi:SDR family oxidoreductase [Candidimonas humi]|uniref:SDR family NAD(P)-dependent oxidoreductase n=1 Tax=Candidimonas humi TaxID=683355 RepID=A0ABV8P2N1_9BURK|nr:SDR family oxidoreductase [Candidimonas humi]MBV6306189.1 SDR family oxidoreductase [Candidimonas humi]